MISGPETKACTPCAKARRKCGRQRPICLRCQTRELGCRYPPAKPSSFVAIVQEDTPNTVVPTSHVASPLDLSFPYLNDTLASWWFAAPSTWTIDPPSRSVTANPSRFSASSLDRALRTILDWLAQWVETGTCPFMHNQLYKACMPDPIQGAYLTLSAYLQRSTLNADILERILEDSVTRLVAEGLHPAESGALSTLDNLARVQALFIYQCIGLSSGSMRIRNLAECYISVLESWIVSLMEQARQILCSTITSVFTYPELSNTVPQQNRLWFSWILSESVRRIWLVIVGIQGIYKLLANKPTTLTASPCMGGTIFTSRKGFWEARDARSWEAQCSERYAGLVRLTETEKMFEMVPKEEISEFARLVLECTYGAEWCEMCGL